MIDKLKLTLSYLLFKSICWLINITATIGVIAFHGGIIWIFAKLITALPEVGKEDIFLVVLCAFLLSVTSLVILTKFYKEEPLLKDAFILVFSMFAGFNVCTVIWQIATITSNESNPVNIVGLVGCVFGIYVIISALALLPAVWCKILTMKTEDHILRHMTSGATDPLV